MFSAGNFSFSPGGGGVEPAWGGNENLTTASLVHVEVTDLDLPSNTSDSVDLYAEDRSSNILEEFGPFPKYLSGYESIILSATDTGTNLPAPEDEEEDDDLVAVVPVSTAPAEPVLTETTPAWREHIVKAGETLSDIAAAYGGITAQDILKANGIKDANRLAEKQLLLIPSDSSHVDDTLDEVRTRQMRIAASTEQLEPIRVKAYVVAPGDSLWSIANAQNIELDTLVGSNTFKTSARLKPGATLRIPNQDGIFYVLKPGETIEAVSKRYGVSMSKIKLVNADRDMAALKPGEEIFLPGAKPEGLIERRDTTRVVEVKKPAPAPAPVPAYTYSTPAPKPVPSYTYTPAPAPVAESSRNERRKPRMWMVTGIILAVLCVLLVAAYFLLEYKYAGWLDKIRERTETEQVLDETDDTGESEEPDNDTTDWEQMKLANETEAEPEPPMPEPKAVTKPEPEPKPKTGQKESVLTAPRSYKELITTEEMRPGSRLTRIAERHYGHKELWVFIYEANLGRLKSPTNIEAGTPIRVPKLSEQLMDVDDPETKELIKQLSEQYLKRQ